MARRESEERGLAGESTRVRRSDRSMEQSATWRAVFRLRRALSRLPPSIRRWLRRAAPPLLKLAYPEMLTYLAGASSGIDFREYDRWQATLNKITQGDRRLITGRVKMLPPRLFSLIVPIYNTPHKAFVEMVESIRAQLYPHWELCLVDDGSSDPEPASLATKYAQADHRIKLMRRSENGGIAAASNSGLQLATGEFVGFVDHDDLLSPHALYMVAEAAYRHPTAEIFYTDEDKIDSAGRRYDPYFKPDWNPELLLGQNFLNHFTVYRRSLIEAIGCFREGFEGSQDYDLVLRATSATQGPIIHIPYVLYGWRIFLGAKTFSATKRAQANSAAKRALIDHFRDAGVEVSVLDAEGGGYHGVRRPDPGEWCITAVIPTRDRADLLRTAVQGLREKTDYPQLEIIIIDNETKEVESLRYLSELEHQGIRVLRVPGPFNYSLMNNLAVAEASGELVLLLNNDTEVIEPGWLKEMTRYFQEKRVAVVGPKLLYPDGTLQHGGVILGIGGVAGHIHVGEPRNSGGYFGRLWLAQDVSCVTGACMLVRRSVFEKVCGFDSESLPVAFNDVDFCLSVRPESS